MLKLNNSVFKNQSNNPKSLGKTGYFNTGQSLILSKSISNNQKVNLGKNSSHKCYASIGASFPSDSNGNNKYSNNLYGLFGQPNYQVDYSGAISINQN